MHDALRVVDYQDIAKEEPWVQNCLKSLVPMWLRQGFAVKSRGKLYILRGVYDRTSILELNAVYMAVYGEDEHPFVILDEADYVDA